MLASQLTFVLRITSAKCALHRNSPQKILISSNIIISSHNNNNNIISSHLSVYSGLQVQNVICIEIHLKSFKISSNIITSSYDNKYNKFTYN